MNRYIEINGIELYGYHGCMPEEKKTGGKYITDVKIHYDYNVAADTDDLTKTVDYCNVYEIVKQEMSIPTKLIETLAKRIAVKVKQLNLSITLVSVKVTKLSPPINGWVNNVAVYFEL